MQRKSLSPADAQAVFAYLASGGAIRVYATGQSAINAETGKAYLCPLPVYHHVPYPAARQARLAGE